jgi:hypothetical protein
MRCGSKGLAARESPLVRKGRTTLTERQPTRSQPMGTARKAVRSSQMTASGELEPTARPASTARSWRRPPGFRNVLEEARDIDLDRTRAELLAVTWLALAGL